MIMHYSSYSMRINSAIMIPCILLSSFAYNYYDGTRNKKATLSQKQLSFSEYPPLLEYLAYLLNFNTILVGPPSNFKDFQRFINREDIKEINTQYRKKNSTAGLKLIDNSIQVGLKTLLIAIMFLILHLVTSKYFTLEDIMEDNFIRRPFIIRLLLIHVIGSGQRFKYYLGMTMAEGSNILSGYGINGYNYQTGKIKWDKNKNVYPIKCEAMDTIFLAPKIWNIKVSNWLRDYIYDRIVIKTTTPETIDQKKDDQNTKPPRMKKKNTFLGTGVTFFVSAIWHGVYPGYYCTFITWFLLTLSARVIRKNIRTFFITSEGKAIQPFKKIYDIICYISTQCVLDIMGFPLLLMTKNRILRFYHTINYWPFYIIPPLLIFFNIPIFVKYIGVIRNIWLGLITKKDQIVNKKNVVPIR
ncbi:oysgedart isoform a [Anaeramoeba flamelloides]|uniref:Oysgedart isoform a n=1 Tax=Anaeramoeba flamelloides TaxID=1746091 RepID=A0AAV8A313_9EUKA|nr:oysgedart isoform a [Anaeramoeba flamelloides]